MLALRLRTPLSGSQRKVKALVKYFSPSMRKLSLKKILDRR
jgi:hypothetical protein